MSIKSIFYILLVILLCSCAEKSVELSWEKTDDHEYLDYGYWIDIPIDFKKANSYAGYQAPQYSSSISIKKADRTFDEILNINSKKGLKQRGVKLLERTFLTLEKDTIGVLIKFDDNRDNIRLRMYLRDAGDVYLVKSFYHEQNASFYEKEIPWSLFSIVKSEIPEENSVADYKLEMASFTLNEAIYTRDGKYPTESPDGLEVKESTIEDVHDLSVKEYLVNTIRKITKDDNIKYRIDRLDLSNGKSYSVSFDTDTNNYYYRITMIKGENDGALYEVIGNKNMDFKVAALLLDYHSTSVQ